MTLVEFNNKYDSWLGDRHYGLTIDNEDVIDFLDEIFQDLIKISDFEYYQIKTKWTKSDVRFYSNLGFALNSAIELKIKSILDKE